ncbi:unnamed protein product [Lampetra fluviatilis]
MAPWVAVALADVCRCRFAGPSTLAFLSRAATRASDESRVTVVSRVNCVRETFTVTTRGPILMAGVVPPRMHCRVGQPGRDENCITTAAAAAPRGWLGPAWHGASCEGNPKRRAG